ncbi:MULTISPECIES: hypothetical protein [unclassified Sporolactobacillus]|nr:hypothetical protein [Sporolactobacillus sp. CQH2019]MDD9150415.1 hypothetical protein [Sporolactobacillus sp. CQH2019]
MKTPEELFLFFAGFQTKMVAKHCMGPARFALKMKSRYFRQMKAAKQ